MTDPSTHSDLEDRLRSHYKADAERVRPRPLELDEVLRLAERAATSKRQSRQQPVEGLAPIVVERRIETARRWPRGHLIIASAVAAAVVLPWDWAKEMAFCAWVTACWKSPVAA